MGNFSKPKLTLLTQMKLAFYVAKTQEGQHEISGSKDNPKIIEYHQACTLQATDDETPWCSSFVNWCYIIAGLLLNREAMLTLLRKAKYEERDIALFVASADACGEKIKNSYGILWTEGINVKLPTRSALARSWAAFATRTKNPKPGDIAVFERGNNGVSGHVGFVDSLGLSYVNTRGGNQGNATSVAPYARMRVIAYITEDAA